MKPRALGAAAVAVAIVALYIATRGDDTKVVRSADVAKITQADHGNAAAPVAPVTAGDAVRARSTGTSNERAAATDYMVGRPRVRDHRSGDRTEDTAPAPVHPPGGRKIPSQLTSDVAQQVRAVMTECAASLPAHARGAEPRLEGTIAIAIKDHRATVTRAAVQLRDVSADAAQPIADCIEQKSVGVATSAGDEADLEAYSITLAFRLP